MARSNGSPTVWLEMVVSEWERLQHLWQQQGQHAAARGLLVPMYGWFTEGFETAALQEARALLENRGA